MTDYEIAVTIAMMMHGGEDFTDSVITIENHKALKIIPKRQATQYYLKKNNAIVVELPDFSPNKKVIPIQIALAVGRRLERFERVAKANATRTPISRKEIAQNAIQTRWSAK